MNHDETPGSAGSTPDSGAQPAPNQGQATTSGAETPASTPPEAQQVAEQLASDGDAVREGVKEEGGQPNA